MVLATIKKYPSQITSAFKRFPLAVAFAIFTTIAFICNCEYIIGSLSLSISDNKLTYWLSIYPIAATMIALTISLVQESRKKFSFLPHAVAGTVWLAAIFVYVFRQLSEAKQETTRYAGERQELYTKSFTSCRMRVSRLSNERKEVKLSWLNRKTV